MLFKEFIDPDYDYAAKLYSNLKNKGVTGNVIDNKLVMDLVNQQKISKERATKIVKYYREVERLDNGKHQTNVIK